MHFKEKKKMATGLKAILIAAAALVVLGGGLGAFLLLNYDPLGAPATPPEAYFAEGELRVLRVAPPDDFSAGDDLRGYFTAAADFAQANGFNTLMFEGKQGLAVWWRDHIFPPMEGISVQDSFWEKTDPLAILGEVLAGRPLQLWLALDPYTAGGLYDGAEGKVAGLAQGGDAFMPGDATYETLLVESLSALPKKYALSGLVFTGFGGGAALGTAGQQAATALLGDVSAVLQAGGFSLPLVLQADADGGVAPHFAAQLVAGGTAARVLAGYKEGAVAEWTAQYAALPAGSLVLAPPAGDGAELFLFGARQAPAYGGALLGSYPADTGRTQDIAQLATTLAPVEGLTLPGGFSIPQILGINYPAQNAQITTSGLFIMGTSDPAQPLLMDGEELPERAPGGAFGVGVELQPGENSFTFTQGDKSLTLNVVKTVSGGGGGGTGGGTATSPEDDTAEAQPGQAVRVSALIASALSNPHDDSTMNETFPAGAVAVVEESVRTLRNGRRTWAYKLKSGDYLLASACEWVDDGEAAFTALTALEDDRGEWLTFDGAGAPAAYVAYGNETGVLSLTFYDTTLQLPGGFSSALVGGAQVEVFDDHLVLSLQTQGIWGYSLEYDGRQTRLYLKKPPPASADAARPLAGVKVLLDPGHGGSDIGAPGIMGEGATPNEKDVNLALATAIAYRLRQLGAEVSLTREGDTFPTLQDRLAAQTLEKPDFFIAVHHNSALLTQDLNGTHGAQVYYYHPYATPASKPFSQNLIDHIAPATGRAGGDARWSYFYVTRTTVCPSVLFEYGFMVNPAEFEQVVSEAGIHAAALATAEGIVASLPAA